MANVTSVSSSHHPAGGHSAEQKLAIHRLGLWLFILSDSFFFAALLASRFYLLGVERSEHLNQTLGLVVSLVLLVSSYTAYRAEVAASYGDVATSRRNLLYTIALGLLFFIGVAFEWTAAVAHFPPSTGFGTIFFTLTGVHATHVLSGVIVLALVWRRSREGRYTGHENAWPVEGAVKYWHFVDVAWVLIYPTLYLVS